MDSNISELVKLWHERADELKASCGAVDVRSVAQLISDLASQLEVQYVRSNALAAELKQSKIDADCYKKGMEASNARLVQLAAENAALKSKAAELVHEASEVYSVYNATITEPDGDFMDMQTLQEMQCVETDVAWWKGEASDLYARVMEQADEIAELRRLVIRVPMPVVVPAHAAAFIGIDLADGKDQTAVIEIGNGEVLKWSR